jgi:histidinol-phosphate phosphatase family protein
VAVIAGGQVAAGVSNARAVFLDKDGTLVENVPYNVDPARLRFTPRAPEALRLLAAHGYRLIVVTNQPGIALGRFDAAALTRLHAALATLVAGSGATLAGFYACPHAPATSSMRPSCACRKPAPGLLRRAAREHGLDLGECWMVGDILDDVEAGRRAGCRTVLMDVGNETLWQWSRWREPDFRAADLLEAARMIVAAPALRQVSAASCEAQG